MQERHLGEEVDKEKTVWGEEEFEEIEEEEKGIVVYLIVIKDRRGGLLEWKEKCKSC